MSIKSIVSTGTVLLLLGAVPSVYGQRDQQGDQGQPQQRNQAKPTAKPAPAKPAARPAPAAAAKPTARPAPTAQPAYGGNYHGGVKPTAAPTHGGVHPSGVPQAQAQVRSGFLQSRASSWTTQHRTWQQRGGYTGYRVPDDRFNQYFGSGHFFEIGSLPLLFVGGYPRFQYDGYWVTLMDPWPENWPPLWYEADNCLHRLGRRRLLPVRHQLSRHRHRRH